ncbi:MAG: hypothetical protein CVT95_05380, partial [Bacteroidetes bacterium HGW-Bacteroidetes-12]
MKKASLFLSLFFFTSFLFTQNCVFSGKIIDATTNEPIAYASIYIASIAKGVMTNDAGEFKLEMPCSNYQAKVQYLGYETVTLSIPATEKTNQTILLKQQAFAIKEFTISAKAEDPAYNIMRKAIALAEYYKKQIKQYDCNIYMKEYFVVDKIPDIAKLFAEKEDLEAMKAGNISEILMEYHYEYPNTTKEKIISSRNSQKDTTKSGSNYINLNFYNLGGNEIVSPLGKNAFQVYKFELLDSYQDDNHTIKKIKIIPKRNGQDLMSGIIYIVDGLWSIHSVDVKFRQNLATISYKQFYSEIKKNTWFPINHEINVEAKLMGFEGNYKYLASISNLSTKNDSIVDLKIDNLVDLPLTGNEAEIDTKMTTKQKENLSKTQQKINDLMEKDKLSKSEAMRLVQLIEKDNESEKKKNNEKENLDKSRDRNVEYADSAFKESNSAWDSLRAVPLSEKEKAIYATNDSLERIENNDTIINKKRSVIGNVLLFNGKIKTKNKDVTLRIPGALSWLSLNFNTVDGFLLKKRLFTFNRKYSNGSYFEIAPSIQYAFAREDLMGNFMFKTQYNAKKRAGFFINTGKQNADFNSEKPMNNFFNSVSTLFFKENYKKLYQKRFIEIGHQFDVANGLTLFTSAEYAKRTALNNHSDFNITDPKKNDYTSNIPISTTNLSLFEDHTSTLFTANLSYTPKYFYRFYKNQKRMLYSNYPTFTASYKQGVNGIFSSDTDFGLLEFSIQQSKKINLIDKVSYYVGAGTFTNTNTLKFADYRGFNTIPFYVSGNTNRNSFRLLDLYQYNSSD